MKGTRYEHALLYWLITIIVVYGQGRPQVFLEGAKIQLSDFDQKSLHLPKCLISMNNNDIIVYN